MVGVENARCVFSVPFCRFNDKLEIMGQFWGEAFNLGLTPDQWSALRSALVPPVAIDYSGVGYEGMTQMPSEAAILHLPTSGQTAWYEQAFHGSDDRRLLKQALAYKDKVVVEEHSEFGEYDLAKLVEFSQGRLGEESYFTDERRVATFRRLCKWLNWIGALAVLRYVFNGEVVGVAFLSIDHNVGELTFMSGFFRNDLNNFGKFMYYTFVQAAERNGCNRVLALSPLSRIKKDMLYQGRTLYRYVA
jgi:hypothetical protein